MSEFIAEKILEINLFVVYAYMFTWIEFLCSRALHESNFFFFLLWMFCMGTFYVRKKDLSENHDLGGRNKKKHFNVDLTLSKRIFF